MRTTSSGDKKETMTIHFLFMIHEISLAFPKHQSQQKLKPDSLYCPLTQTFCDQTRRPRASGPPGPSHCSRSPLLLTCLVLGFHASLPLMRGSAHCSSLHCSILYSLSAAFRESDTFYCCQSFLTICLSIHFYFFVVRIETLTLEHRDFAQHQKFFL